MLGDTDESTDCPHRMWDIDNANKGTCRGCGEVRQYPLDGKSDYIVVKKGNPIPVEVPKKEGNMVKGGQRMVRHAYYEENKEAILADLHSMGRTPTRKKWKIAASSLVALERRWLTKEGKDAIETSKIPLEDTGKAPPVAGDFPGFPEFSDTWAPEVQAAWLQAYAKLKGPEEKVK